MKTRIFLVLVTFLLLLAGCGKAPEVDIPATQTFESALQTALAETLEAATMEDGETPSEGSNASPTPVVTLEVIPTFTPLPTSVPVSTPTPTTEPQAANPTDAPTPCYRAEMISETIPDGSVFNPGQIFTKIWVIRNTGVCEWTEDFTWTLVEGEDFGVPTVLELNRSVLPGEDLEVKLEMQTPLLEGGYQGTYQILTEEGGSVTPLGFWVYIVSQKPE